MPALLEYMMKITAAYTVIYLFYWLVLRRLTSYNSNRFYLLAAGLFAFIFPLRGRIILLRSKPSIHQG
ncbi:hypothetical protein [Parafilimonas sp.]|uniref:hypothetical protein n=1 Tax=Parafilimonas sp. TaxID=1969739 RepID=UPI0039E5724B